MRTVLIIVILAGLSVEAQSAGGQSGQSFDPKPAMAPAGLDKTLSALPPDPAGRTTIIGGEIRNVDPVRDQFELHVFGQGPMKILYDERTRAYRDGTRFPLLDLGSEDHASVETVLDGENVFAVSIHILSQSPEGDCEGRVLSFNPRNRELLISSLESPEPVKLLVPANASIARTGQSTFTSGSLGSADLVPGAIVSATFQSEPGREDTASKISVLAVPGASFFFSGNVSFVDLNAGLLILIDSQDQKSYEIHFNSGNLAISNKLRTGENVSVTASYDGQQYAASNISIN
jgi:hypothetical protein